MFDKVFKDGRVGLLNQGCVRHLSIELHIQDREDYRPYWWHFQSLRLCFVEGMTGPVVPVHVYYATAHQSVPSRRPMPFSRSRINARAPRELTAAKTTGRS